MITQTKYRVNECRGELVEREAIILIWADDDADATKQFNAIKRQPRPGHYFELEKPRDSTHIASRG